MSFRKVSLKSGTVSRKQQIWPKIWNYNWVTENIHGCQGEKNRQITAKKEEDILLDTVIRYDCQQKITLYVPKIKSFFSKTPYKMQDIIQGASDEINNDEMEQMEIGDAK